MPHFPLESLRWGISPGALTRGGCKQEEKQVPSVGDGVKRAWKVQVELI